MREKLVYVLNPDGLTESIFVARGEANEGQYRGKRFTKAGLKAEKKRIKEEAKQQAKAQYDAINSQIEKPEEKDFKKDEQFSLSYNEYYSTEPIKILDDTSLDYNDLSVADKEKIKVLIHGSMSGWIGVFDKDSMLNYRETQSPFLKKDDIKSILNIMNVDDVELSFYKNPQGIIVFRGSGLLSQEKDG
jgi:hypothetical protein